MLVLVLAGCQGDMSRFRCVTWDELDLTDPAGGAPADVFAEVRAAIDQFAAWNARDGLCVEEVRLVDQIDDERDPVGLYYGSRIEVEYAAMDPTWVTFHELCHAADDTAGALSDAHPDWFGTEDPAEVFAEACAYGPRAVTALEGLEAACAEDFGSGRQRLLNAEVFGAAEIAEEPPAGTLDIRLERRLVELPDDVTPDVSVGGTAVYFLRVGTDADGARRADLVQLDAATGALRSVAGPVIPDGAPGVGILDGNAEPLIVFDGEARAWRVDEVAGVAEEVPFLAFERLHAGVVIDGVAWVRGIVEGEAEVTFSGVDLVTGARDVRSVPEGVFAWYPGPDGTRVAGAAYLVDRWTWLVYDPAADVWTEPATPAGWAGTVRLTLPDGRTLATWMDGVGVDLGLVTLSVLDPEAGAWWLPDAPCGDDSIERSHTLLSVGGDPWLWENTPEGPALTRVEVP